VVNRLVVVIGCDADPDGDLHPQARLAGCWRGVDEGIPRLVDLLDRRFDGRPRVTWLLRADRQIEIVAGAYDYLFESRQSLWRDLAARGDEIGWHPHLFAWSPDADAFVPSLEAADFPRDALRAAHAGCTKWYPVKSVRTGWSFHSNQLMSLLDEEGVQVDFSALPGSRVSVPRPAGGVWSHDWSGAPTEPYHPSRQDYRRPGAGGESLDVLELPVTQVPVPAGRRAARFARRLARSVREAELDRPRWRDLARRTVRVTQRATALDAEIDRLAARAASGAPTAFVTYFHPHELLQASALDCVAHNLEVLNRAAETHQIELHHATASAAAKLLGGDPRSAPPNHKIAR
jgi:hypothetical protein